MNIVVPQMKRGNSSIKHVTCTLYKQYYFFIIYTDYQIGEDTWFQRPIYDVHWMYYNLLIRSIC